MILAVFLGGLSLGYRAFGGLSARTANPLRSYALLEGGIGAWCLAFPVLFSWVERATEGLSFAPPWFLLSEGSLTALVLLGPPTLLMGGTMPLLTRALSESLDSSTQTHARIYAVNTAGAVLGSLLAGFWLLFRFGLPGTLHRTAVVNLVAAGVFLLLSRSRGPSHPLDERDEGSLGTGSVSEQCRDLAAFTLPALNAIAFLSGVYVMTLENVLIRYTSLAIGSSSYAFSLVVSVFVLSIAIGGLAVSRKRRFSRSLLAWNQITAVLLLLLLFTSLDKWPYVGHLLRIACQSNLVGFVLFQVVIFAALTLSLVAPISLLGATLPLAFHERRRELSRVGEDSGALFSWNALGCLLGGLGGGILLHYVLDNAGVFLLAAGLCASSALLAARPVGFAPKAGACAALGLVALFAFLRPFHDEKRFAAGTFRHSLPLPYSLEGAREFYEEFYGPRKVVFYRDGPGGTVAVTQAPPLEDSEDKDRRQPLAIFVNGKSDSNTYGDRETLRLSAHIPALWATSRKKVMIIGLGTGCTAGEFTLYKDVESIDVAEISPTVIEVLPFFSRWNRSVVGDPRLHLVQGDALRVLRRSKKTWDILVSEPSNPWVTGTDQLFSREFYHLVKAHLSKEGLLLQWVQGYSIDEEAFGMIMNSLKTEFPNVYLFRGTTGDILVLANSRPLNPEDRFRAEAAWDNFKGVRESLEPIGMSSLYDLFGRELLPLLRKIDSYKPYGIETLDHPRLHYVAGLTAFTGDSLQDARQGR